MVEDLLEYLVRSLVDAPDDVSVESFDEDDGSLILELRVGEQDVGRVIGRHGRTIAALRTLMRACSASEGQRILVDVLD